MPWRFQSIFFRNWKLQLLVFFFSLLAIASQLVFPWSQKLLIDGAIANKSVTALVEVSLLLIIAAFGFVFFEIARGITYTIIGEKTDIQLKNEALKHAYKINIDNFSSDSGNILSHFTSDISAYSIIYRSSASKLIISVIKLLSIITVLLFIDWRTIFIAVILIPVYAILPLIASRLIRKVSLEVQNNTARLTSVIQDILLGMRELKSNVEVAWIKNYASDPLTRIYKSKVKQSLVQSLFVVNISISYFILAILYIFGGSMVIHDTLSLGSLIAIANYLSALAQPIGQITDSYSSIQSSLAARERLELYLNLEKDIGYGNKPLSKKIDGNISIRNLSFSYPRRDNNVLKNINLDISAGETVAIVGPSGAGKSSIALIVAGFYKPNQGNVLIDGMELCKLDIVSYRKNIGFVFQDPYLFNISIKENILLGNPNSSMEDVIQAAKSANAHQFITEFSEGYDTVVGQGGTNFSGGQRQRIAMARIFLKNPMILIMDEATSALDSTSETAVKHAVSNLMKGRTNIVITHKLDSIKNSDLIIVVDNMSIVEYGRHESLISKKNAYYQMLINSRTKGKVI
jgi:ABC-type multidrug transport system fused ATPase/permease subunit